MNASVETLVENLRKKGYEALYFDTRAALIDYLCAELVSRRIGFGGSETLAQLGLYECLSAQNEVVWHWRVPEGKTVAELRRSAAECEVYFSSANAVAESGEIVNIDGTANRVAALLYGREEVFYIIGVNKITPTLSAAIDRARNVAAPKNTQRLGLDTPCAKAGDRCYDCKSPQRICRALSVLWERPTGQRARVLIVGEELGF